MGENDYHLLYIFTFFHYYCLTLAEELGRNRSLLNKHIHKSMLDMTGDILYLYVCYTNGDYPYEFHLTLLFTLDYIILLTRGQHLQQRID